MVLLLLSSCALWGTKEEKTARELAQEGTARFEKGDYRQAIEAFEKLRDWYPFDPLSTVAELKIADSHYHLKEYDQAVIAYQEFENLHPRHGSTPYVVYQIGRCYFEQINSVDRDQSTTEKALHSFLRMENQYPDDPYTRLAREHIQYCYKMLAGHEFYVGRFYYRTRQYKAALERFKGLVRDYPDMGVHKEALQFIALCRQQLASADSD